MIYVGLISPVLLQNLYMKTLILSLIIGEPNDHFISAPLKLGFHHVLVRKEDRKYLGIYWRGFYYQWRVLPLGLSSSPYFFCKVLKPGVQYLREQGLKVVYVDILPIPSGSNIDTHRLSCYSVLEIWVGL